MVPLEFQDALRRFGDDAEVVRRYVTGDSRGCKILSSDQYVDLKEKLATQLNVHPTEVVVVGSAKLGFSIAPHKRWRKFDPDSERPSDIDVAIVSSRLYVELWEEMTKLSSDRPKSMRNERNPESWHSYHAAGWIRPDKMPGHRNFRGKDEWFELFRKLTASGLYGGYKISGGLYFSHSFLEAYQSKSVQLCRER